MPQVADLSVAVAMAAMIISLRLLLAKLLQPIARAVLPPGKRESAFRVDRFATSLFKFLHFSVITAIGLGLTVNEKWFIESLGGTGDVLEPLRMFNVPPSTGLKLYLLAEVAYQLHSFVFVLLLKPIDSDTMDFVVHDLISMALMAAAYLCNYVATGAIAALINDVCDVFQYGFFMATDSGRKTAVAPLLLMVVASWGYLRLYVFPRDCLYNYIVVSPQVNPNTSMLFLHPVSALFTLLVALHAFWLVLFVKKGAHVLLTGRAPTSRTGKKIQTK